MLFDLAIVGGGPAAAAAAVYAGRKQLKTVVIAEEMGGQSAVSETIYNWIGTPTIGGGELATALRTHVEAYTPEKTDGTGTVTLSIGKRAEKVSKKGDETFVLTLSDGSTLDTKAVLIATGSRHRKLDVPGAAQFDNKGVMYCATCDGPLFSGMHVAVIGGGNAAFEAAIQLTQYAAHVTLLHRSEEFRADPTNIEHAKQSDKITIITNATVASVDGSGAFVERLSYTVAGSPDIKELAVSGVFVEIGQLPNTELVADLAERNQGGKIVVDPYTQRTSVIGLWAAGDCTNGLYHQNNIAAGDAVKAIEDLYFWLKTGK